MPSLRKAINDKCRECLYDPKARGAWREQVTACTSPDCPLFPVRPKTSARATGTPKPGRGRS